MQGHKGMEMKPRRRSFLSFFASSSSIPCVHASSFLIYLFIFWPSSGDNNDKVNLNCVLGMEIKVHYTRLNRSSFNSLSFDHRFSIHLFHLLFFFVVIFIYEWIGQLRIIICDFCSICISFTQNGILFLFFTF